MTKYVEVEACRGCIFAQINYVEYLGRYDNACKKARRPLDQFGWDTTVPAWCPLPDLMEKGTNYVADHESHPKQFKFENGRRVWVTKDGFLDTDFGQLQPYTDTPNLFKTALGSAPIHRLGETESDFIERYKEWYRDIRKECFE